MKTLHKLGTALILFSFFAGFNSCEKPESESTQKGKIEISFDLNDPGILKSAEIDSSNEKMAHLLLTILNSEGVTVMEDEIVPIYQFGNGYMTGKIEMEPGRYSMTKFLVISESNKILFAAPLTGSPRAYLVSTPLPLKFAIRPEETTRIVPEVLPIGNSQPSDFGYANFGFQIVNPLPFFAYAIIDNPLSMRPSQMTDALLKVYTSDGWSHEFKLQTKINKLIVPAGAGVYTFQVIKEGFETQKFEFTQRQLKESSENNPIVFKFPWGPVTNPLRIQPGPMEGKDAMITDLAPEKNFGDFPFFEATFRSESILTVMRTTMSLIHFRLNELPKSARIDSVFLYLSFEKPYYDSMMYAGNLPPDSRGLVLQQITEPWEEGEVTWAKQPQTIKENQVRVPFMPHLSTNRIRINVSPFFISLYDKPAFPNFGMMLKMPEPKDWQGMRFASSDFGQAQLRPMLEVFYTSVN